MRSVELARAATVVLGAFLMSGCYTYQAVDRPTPGTEVRIRVPVASGVERRAGAEQTMLFEGVVLSARDTLLLETRSTRPVPGLPQMLTRDTLRVAPSGIRSIEEKIFSTPRTIAFSAVTAAGVVGLVAAIINVTTGSDGGGDGTPPPPNAVPLTPLIQILFGR